MFVCRFDLLCAKRVPGFARVDAPALQVGSAQNVSMVNTVLCTIFAESFAMMSDAIEAGKKPADVAKEFLKEHWKVHRAIRSGEADSGTRHDIFRAIHRSFSMATGTRRSGRLRLASVACGASTRAWSP